MLIDEIHFHAAHDGIRFTLERVLKWFEADSNAVVCGGKVDFIDEHDKVRPSPNSSAAPRGHIGPARPFLGTIRSRCRPQARRGVLVSKCRSWIERASVKIQMAGNIGFAWTWRSPSDVSGSACSP